MLPYWIMFLLPALAALNAAPSRATTRDGSTKSRLSAGLFCSLAVLTVMVGFRFEVGGDWFNYFRHLDHARWLTFADLQNQGDPGYVAFNIVAAKSGWGMTGVNVLSALVFGAGLAFFLTSLPRPWLGLACAVPYLIIVIGMGYTRQSIALALVMVGLVYLRQQKARAFVMWVILGALFHKTAVLVIPLAAMTAKKRRLQALGLVGVFGYASYDALLAQHADRLVDVYVTQQLTQSQGAFIRLSMNAVPAALLLLYRKRFDMPEAELQLWKIMSVTALAMLGALATTGFSTALDRMALYFIPLQLVVFSYLPDILGPPNRKNAHIVALILFYYAAVLFVWLNFAAHSEWWLPYQAGLSTD